ncbi:MAG TPA: N-acetylmuramoyl-L-alanine amidase [Paludibacteraceae bacterium]|jgi:N-acetylmuramoyl-L-alanine amidase|nr:N-acetylmuramoyl-L-alanine amidase [Paludibacteraceae bacterium]HRS67769.1 N-acetylmuramoyl-L-alanine amidase [Paludibacteraceae bacterium]
MKRFFVYFIFSLSLLIAYASPKPFTVIIDPGHGGKDPGALGPNGREKDINLSVSLKLGELIKKNHPDVNVVFTRDTDKYVPLQDRSSIANKANGDLFICIHTNASKSRSAYGSETYTIGLDKTNANFEVAKRENSVILLEEGYKEKYQGFDPTSPDSYIMFEFMQSKFSDKSIEFAAYTQDEFTTSKRYNRGVRQENFWVLHQTKMPSVLIELGFITNPLEERFLLSKDGQNIMANSIYKAFAKYKHEHDKKSVAATVIPETEPIKTEKLSQQTSDNKLVYQLQLFISRKEITDGNDQLFRGLKDCTYYKENDWFKYTYGSANTLDEILELKSSIKAAFPEAFIVVFYNGKKISLQEAEKISKRK